jgi:hypothetical protein
MAGAPAMRSRLARQLASSAPLSHHRWSTHAFEPVLISLHLVLLPLRASMSSTTTVGSASYLGIASLIANAGQDNLGHANLHRS